MFPTSNKTRLAVILFLFGGTLHLIINGRPSVDMNFSVMDIDDTDYEAMASVIANAATHSTPVSPCCSNGSETKFGDSVSDMWSMRRPYPEFSETIFSKLDVFFFILKNEPRYIFYLNDNSARKFTEKLSRLLHISEKINMAKKLDFYKATARIKTMSSKAAKTRWPNKGTIFRVWQDGPSLESIQKLYPTLEMGGHGKPANCTSQHRVAIVIPYRDREEHLRIFLHNIHSFLQKQQLDYTIVVVEQVANQTFNRAKLMNVGYAEAMKLYPWECFIFHDVDLLPEDDRNLYTCPIQPRHMSVAVDKFGYKLPYGSIFGGISALTVQHFKKINGFSNDYWGWGGEDDDLSTRVVLGGYKISRYPVTIARYKMIKHTRETTNPINKCRYKLMAKTKRRWRKDGLSTLNYQIVKLELLPLYIRVTVDLLEEESRDILKREVPC